jgi:hypothetical protein
VEPMRADISMRLLIDGDSYAKVGRLMDRIDGAVRDALEEEGVERALFDFTGFNTHPCKALELDRLNARQPEPMLADAMPSYYENRQASLPRVTTNLDRPEPQG